MVGRDHTLHALEHGEVAFSKVQVPGKIRNRFRTLVNVVPSEARDTVDLVEFTAGEQKRLNDSHQYRLWRKDAAKREYIGNKLTPSPV